MPSVLLSAEAAKTPTAHKIHILGDDERSKFIAHALSGVYDSVELLAWRNSSSKYPLIQKKNPQRKREASTPIQPLVTPRILAKDDDSHIDQLFVSGMGRDAVEALQSVKHRIDDKTSICLMNDGLGVLEDVREKVFNGTHTNPNFMLGHMSHRLAWNRRHNSVKELRSGQLQLTLPYQAGIQTQTDRNQHFVESLRAVKSLNTLLTPLDQWLRFKLPSVIFDSVAEPVCVFLDMPYQGLLQNPAAGRMMSTLLSEILLVIEAMPEVEGSTIIRDFIRGKGPKRLLYNNIMAKQSQTSELARKVAQGKPTDIDYLNGYFAKRAKQLSLDMPTNAVMREMIKAKHSQAIEKRNSYIPVEETSIPSDQWFKYRSLPRSH